MKFLRRFDDWVLDNTQIVLGWVDDWLALSQRRVERILVVLYIVTRVAFEIACFSDISHAPLWIEVSISILMVWAVLARFRLPQAVRVAYRVTEMPWRMVWWALIVMGCIQIFSDKLPGVLLTVNECIFAAILYVTVSCVGGERGRKAKMAWSKLKELFSWLPEPIPEGV